MIPDHLRSIHERPGDAALPPSPPTPGPHVHSSQGYTGAINLSDSIVAASQPALVNAEMPNTIVLGNCLLKGRALPDVSPTTSLDDMNIPATGPWVQCHRQLLGSEVPATLPNPPEVSTDVQTEVHFPGTPTAPAEAESFPSTSSIEERSLSRTSSVGLQYAPIQPPLTPPPPRSTATSTRSSYREFPVEEDSVNNVV